jgi:ribonucleoside-triphosphate reductase
MRKLTVHRPTYSITKDFDWDTESINNKLLFEMTAKYGIPYFSNYINSDMKPSDIRSMCCRLRLDLRELRKKNGGYFGSGESTGSVGVVTINMPRLAYKSKSETEFFDNLDKLMDIAARSLHIKRSVVSQYLENGLYPYTKRYLGNLNNHFSTLAVLGMNEACLNASWIRDNIASDSGYSFSKKVLDHMRDRLSDYQELYPGELFNLESAPAESTTLRFALHDKKDFPDIITAGDNTDGAPYYTNSSHLPVGYTDDIFTALDHQDDLQTKYTSGTVFHAFLGEKLPSWQSAMALTRKIAENYKLPYFTFSPTYSICPEHGYIKGEEWTCPICGKTTEVYSRVTGYYRAVQNFNDGKAHEFKDRKEYVVNTDEVADEPDFECESCKVEYVDSSDTDTTYSDPVSSLETHKPMLFTTATCPNCKMAKKFISDAGFDCDNLLAEENTELVKQYNINSAPTLVVFENGQPRNIQNVSNIRKFLDSINK